MSEQIRPEHAERVRDFYRNQGAAKERERICKILEKYATTQCDPECGYSCECFGKYEAVHFIERIRETALIKGETNE